MPLRLSLPGPCVGPAQLNLQPPPERHRSAGGIRCHVSTGGKTPFPRSEAGKGPVSVCARMCVCVCRGLHTQPCRQPRCYSRYSQQVGTGTEEEELPFTGPPRKPARSPRRDAGSPGPGGCGRERGPGAAPGSPWAGDPVGHSTPAAPGSCWALRRGSGSICRTRPRPGAPVLGVPTAPGSRQPLCMRGTAAGDSGRGHRLLRLLRLPPTPLPGSGGGLGEAVLGASPLPHPCTP